MCYKTTAKAPFPLSNCESSRRKRERERGTEVAGARNSMACGGVQQKKVVVAVDEGEESMHALSWCLKNMVTSDDPNHSLLLVHAKAPRVVYPSVDAAGCVFSADLMAAMDRYAVDTSDSVIEKAKRACKELRNVKVETRVENGDPRDVICKMVKREGADTLVMGSRGYGPLKRAFLGSVSGHCAQNVNCPVLIVKKPTTS